MAIDSRRKRASVAVLGLAFLGPSIVADGTLAQADRQAVAHSYYGIEAGGSFVTIGDTSQLEAFTSTGGITRERVIGGTSQLEGYDATGGLTTERTLGGASQIEAFASSGTIQVGDVVVPVNPGTSAGTGRGSRIYLPPAPAKKKPRKSKVKAESARPELKVVEKAPLETELGDFQSRISETPEIPPFPFGDTLKNLENAPEPEAKLDPQALTQLIASLVDSKVSEAMNAETMRQDGLKILAALEKELDEDEPLDPKIEEFLLLLLLV